jgi:Mrp family chromosome partitioning ATPase
MPAPGHSTPAQLTTQGQQIASDLLLDPRQGGRILGVTSPLGGEGKTLLAAVIALTLARSSRKRTVLVEGTWQRPTLPVLFDLPAGPGLAEWLRGECDEANIRRAVGERLVVVPAGNAADGELLLLERLQGIGIVALAGPDDFVVVDLPSVLPGAAGRLATGLVERVVVVARAGVTPLPAIVDTCDQLRDLAIQGIVLNQVERWVPRWLDRIL